jgi:hypothetical protein
MRGETKRVDVRGGNERGAERPLPISVQSLVALNTLLAASLLPYGKGKVESSHFSPSSSLATCEAPGEALPTHFGRRRVCLVPHLLVD